MLKKALEVAVAFEAADLKARKLQSSKSAQLEKVEQIPSTCKNKKPCYRCGKQNHSPSDCKYQNFVCRKVIWPKCAVAGHKVMTSLLMLETAHIRKLTG